MQCHTTQKLFASRIRRLKASKKELEEAREDSESSTKKLQHKVEKLQRKLQGAKDYIRANIVEDDDDEDDGGRGRGRGGGEEARSGHRRSLGSVASPASKPPPTFASQLAASRSKSRVPAAGGSQLGSVRRTGVASTSVTATQTGGRGSRETFPGHSGYHHSTKSTKKRKPR